MSGIWGLVAICVTQPLCPFNVPLRTNCSAMMYRFSCQFRRIVHRSKPRWRSYRGKRERKVACHDFKTGADLNDFFEGGVGGANLLHEIEALTHVWSDVATAILFALVELYKFSTNFHRILAVLASASLSGVFDHLLLASWKVW